MLKPKVAAFVGSVLTELDYPPDISFLIDTCPRPELGDYATNAALIYGRKLSRNPLELAKNLAAKIKENDQNGIFDRIEAVPPGFINFAFSAPFIQNLVKGIKGSDHDWGKTDHGKGEKVLLEFISANPTGPLHVGHGRWAVIGDVIGRLLSAAGSAVNREYYINDVGNQINKLVLSVEAVREGKTVPEGGYGGEYIKELADRTEIKERKKIDSSFSKLLIEIILAEQKKTIQQLGISFDRWYFESELHAGNKVKAAVQKLHDLGVTFEEGGAIWFKSQALGDDKNRVLIREDGQSTYFASDIAYHLDKFERGFDHLINIWGTDHHGYIGRLKAAMKILGQPADKLEIIIGQLVTLYRGSEPVRMSKRTGEMVTLQEVIDEIGADATRFFFSATAANSHLDFDLELAKKKSNDNPVYYVQYAHARISSILSKSQILNPKSQQGVDLSDLNHPAERELMLKLLSYPDLVEEAARLRHPHRLTEYGKELATVFHHFYEKCRVLGNPSRLFLVDTTRITIRNVLELLGILAPETM